MFKPRTVDRRRCWSGTLVTMASSLAPARRATRVPPLAAMREDAAQAAAADPPPHGSCPGRC